MSSSLPLFFSRSLSLPLFLSPSLSCCVSLSFQTTVKRDQKDAPQLDDHLGDQGMEHVDIDTLETVHDTDNK